MGASGSYFGSIRKMKTTRWWNKKGLIIPQFSQISTFLLLPLCRKIHSPVRPLITPCRWEFQGRCYTFLFPPLHHHQLHHHLIYQMKFCVCFLSFNNILLNSDLFTRTSTHFLVFTFNFFLLFSTVSLYSSVIQLVLAPPKLIVLQSRMTKRIFIGLTTRGSTQLKDFQRLKVFYF